MTDNPIILNQLEDRADELWEKYYSIGLDYFEFMNIKDMFRTEINLLTDISEIEVLTPKMSKYKKFKQYVEYLDTLEEAYEEAAAKRAKVNNNFLVVTYHDNDYSRYFTEAMKCIYNEYVIYEKGDKGFQKLKDMEDLKEKIISIAACENLKNHILWGRACNMEDTKKYLEKVKIEFKDDFSFREWSNSEKIYLNCNTGDISTF